MSFSSKETTLQCRNFREASHEIALTFFSFEMRQPESYDTKLEMVHRFFAGTGTTYDFMVKAATFGIDGRWKRRIVNLLPSSPANILDLACGTGISTLAIVNRYPTSRVVGVELREEYLAQARAKFHRLGLTNTEFVLCRAEDYHSPEPFDCVVSSYLAKYADLDLLTRNSKTMLKDGGLLLMHDFTYPPPSLVWLWKLYFWTLQHIGSPLFPTWREIYYGLPQVIQESHWIPKLTTALQDHGFKDIRREDLTAYGSAIITARR